MNPSVSIVVPAYSEAERIAPLLDELLPGLTALQAELIVVDDGSTDTTAEFVRSRVHGYSNARLLQLGENRGKGAAVRAGVEVAAGDRIAFMDADLATDLSSLPELLAALDHSHISIGSRAVLGATTTGAPAHRVRLGRAFNRLVRSLTDVDLLDTQCGFKAFRSPVARLLFALGHQNGFGFDVEILALARRIGYDVAEVPVQWTAVAGSKVRPFADSFAMAGSLLRTRASVRDKDILGIAAHRIDGAKDDGHGLTALRATVNGAGPVMGWRDGLLALLPFVRTSEADHMAREFAREAPAFRARAIDISASAICRSERLRLALARA